jgi:TPR repeat protein
MMENMADPKPDRWKEFSFRNPLVWLGVLLGFLLFLKAVLPQQYVETLPTMLSAAGRCGMARQELHNDRDAAAICAYGIKAADAESQIFVAEVYFQNKAYGAPEQDAEALKLFKLAEAQLLRRAEGGEREAQDLLGKLYSHSVLQNGAGAAKWFCAAAKQRSSDAFTQLAILQGGQMFKTLYEGPDAYAGDARDKYNVETCKVESFEGGHIGPRVTDTLCPYKRETRQDGCNYNYGR